MVDTNNSPAASTVNFKLLLLLPVLVATTVSDLSTAENTDGL